MEENVIQKVSSMIGRDESEVWRLIRDGFLTITYEPLWGKDGETREFATTFTLRKVTS